MTGMQIGLHIMNFTWPGGPAAISSTLGRALDAAEDAGVHSFWPMDHFFQMPGLGGPDQPMLEVYSTLSWAAARTRRMQLGALVTGVHYRHPGVLLKAVSTLDVLSGGRAWFGIGAAWNEEESRGLGVPMPPLAERFERLEETLQVARQMFAGDAASYSGQHYSLERPLNNPAPLRRPPIMVGGSGEKKTLRLVAQYADACNIWEGPSLARKLDVLRAHCDDVGRSYDDIVKTTYAATGEPDLARARGRFAALAELGVDLAIVNLPDPDDPRIFGFLAELVEFAAPLGRSTPAQLLPAAA